MVIYTIIDKQTGWSAEFDTLGHDQKTLSRAVTEEFFGNLYDGIVDHPEDIADAVDTLAGDMLRGEITSRPLELLKFTIE